ncbi:MAG: hypothetical protein HOU81_20270 [Hamadaea sp.]|uniref:TolB family protein n=1 Tax=Hamadaea sp. TaxID=2024425 RepID=UPI0017DC0C19|nr:hypothetical protein [Hamadaea sp.]NUR73160.1 hypothetical protein [Hamadaea sp.]NUT18474.1 hypothetical protein [Hamadaea sp.]
MRIRAITLAVASLIVITPAQAHAASPPDPIAFVRGGDVWVRTAAKTFPVSHGGHAVWPRLSPDKSQIAYAESGNVVIAYIGGGPENVYSTELTHGKDAGGPAWSPDGRFLAYRAGEVHSGLLTILRLGSAESGRVTVAGREEHAAPRVGFDQLRTANTLDWSPDGKSIAFPGGDCWGIYDDCLTVLDLASNTEKTIAAWGGGGQELSGFATTPRFSGDSRKLFWTQQEDVIDQSDPSPLRAYGFNLATEQRWQVGVDGDTVPVHLGNGHFIVTARHAGTNWVAYLSGTAHTWLVPGGQADARR